MSAPTSVPDTALGFTHAELRILRQQQQLIAQQAIRRGIMVDRGRGTSRHSQPSSRAASATSSHSLPGRIALDASSLSNLNTSLDNLLMNVRRRIQQLEIITQQSIQESNTRAIITIQQADEQIARMRHAMDELEELDKDCLSILRIRDVVKQLRQRVDTASVRLDKAPPSNHHGRAGQAVSARSDPRRR